MRNSFPNQIYAVDRIKNEDEVAQCIYDIQLT